MSELRLVLSAESLHPEQLDRLTRQVAADLRALGGFAVDRATGVPSEAQKSGVVQSIDTLVLTGAFSVALVRAVRDVLVAWLGRNQSRRITIRAGDREVDLTAVSAADLEHVAASLDRLVDGPVE